MAQLWGLVPTVALHGQLTAPCFRVLLTLIDLMQDLRTWLGRAFVVNSAYTFRGSVLARPTWVQIQVAFLAFEFAGESAILHVAVERFHMAARHSIEDQ
jgi:hypothetical protein